MQPQIVRRDLAACFMGITRTADVSYIIPNGPDKSGSGFTDAACCAGYSSVISTNRGIAHVHGAYKMVCIPEHENAQKTPHNLLHG
jgi:hypothetical protein